MIKMGNLLFEYKMLEQRWTSLASLRVCVILDWSTGIRGQELIGVI